MPTRQAANNNQSYQTFTDRIGGYSNAIMAQLLAAPDEQMTDFNDMVQLLTAAPNRQMIDFNEIAAPPSGQIIDFNGMMQPLAVDH